MLDVLRRALSKPPQVVLYRMAQQARAAGDRWRQRLGVRFDSAALLGATGSASVDELWQRLRQAPYVAARQMPEECEACLPGVRERLLAAAEEALAHRVDLLGSGPVELGPDIDWQRDFKSGHAWPRDFSLRMQCSNPDDASDVKVPWDLSRLQWLIPAGQAYLLTGDERYAQGIRAVLDSWIEGNPYAVGVNWACTMEVALRILTWTWFFHVCAGSAAWAEPEFRGRFLTALYLHGRFAARYLEYTDVNGNHYTADVAGLVFAGLFFDRLGAARRWADMGWRILEAELPRQVLADGVDFEASIPYHRLVLELFLLPALYRQAQRLDVAPAYRDALIAMAHFTRAYARPDGSIPLWGDADDARALPFGTQPLNDHRYLLGLVGAAWDVQSLRAAFAGQKDEVFWLLGAAACRTLPDATQGPPQSAQVFAEAGCYIMRSALDHVFIDAGPVGMSGRGGHGHNDCLSFEAVLDGCHLVSDCGSFVYTASYQERNRFRSTAAHNTPQIDGAEINRVRPDFLWGMSYDAVPEVRRWRSGADAVVLQAAHRGYQRLSPPVTPVRTIILDPHLHVLWLRDVFEGEGNHRFEVPLHLAPAVVVTENEPGRIGLQRGGQLFMLHWAPVEDWQLAIEPARVSPSYGVTVATQRLAWRRDGATTAPLLVCLAPASLPAATLWDRFRELCATAGLRGEPEASATGET